MADNTLSKYDQDFADAMALKLRLSREKKQKASEVSAPVSQRKPQCELGVERIDRILFFHPEPVIDDLVTPVRRQAVTQERNQSGRGRADIDDRNAWQQSATII